MFFNKFNSFETDATNKTQAEHTVYCSNTNSSWKDGIKLYRGNIPSQVIDVISVCRYIIYVPPDGDDKFRTYLCELEVAGKISV